VQFKIEIGDQPKTQVSFYRNWFTGTLRILVDGTPVVTRSALNPLTHFSTTLTRAYSFLVGNEAVTVVKKRPLFMAGLRPQTYIVVWRGNEIARYGGY
jgi:hypothetical protein